MVVNIDDTLCDVNVSGDTYLSGLNIASSSVDHFEGPFTKFTCASIRPGERLILSLCPEFLLLSSILSAAERHMHGKRRKHEAMGGYRVAHRAVRPATVISGPELGQPDTSTCPVPLTAVRRACRAAKQPLSLQRPEQDVAAIPKVFRRRTMFRQIAHRHTLRAPWGQRASGRLYHDDASFGYRVPKKYKLPDCKSPSPMSCTRN